MAQIDLSKQPTEWIERAIIANVQEFESIMVAMNDDEERQNSTELDQIDEWIDELQNELNRRTAS